MKSLKRLVRDGSGQFAIIFGLAAVPIAGAAGLAVDYTMASNVRSQLQNGIDNLALAIASGGEEAADEAIIEAAVDALEETLTHGTALTNISVEGEWVDISDYRVTAAVEMPTSLSSIIYGGPLAVSTSVTARYKGAAYRYEVPKVAQLDPEAWDYNRISVYCFNPAAAANVANVGAGNNNSSNNGKGNGNGKSNGQNSGNGQVGTGSTNAQVGRSEMTAIADNNGGTYQFTMPECPAGQALSLKLWNVREAKHHRENPNTSRRDKYTYYTDTVIEDDVEQYDLDGKRLVETVICDDLDECKPVTQEGGIIPVGKGRDPQIATEPCAPGKFRYYGFEDRPPENGGSDRDYDDIRVIIECPEKILTGPETVRLLR